MKLASFDWGPMLHTDFLSPVYVPKLIFDLFVPRARRGRREAMLVRGKNLDCIKHC